MIGSLVSVTMIYLPARYRQAKPSKDFIQEYNLLGCRDQNSTGLIRVLGPNNCQAIRNDVRPSIDKGDCQLRDNLKELIIPGQTMNPAAMGLCFVRFLLETKDLAIRVDFINEFIINIA